jgi:hypothetical protein
VSEISIRVLSDPDPRYPGETILRLTGVALLPPGSTYRIDPVDHDGTAELPDGWPAGELKPCAQRITHDGVDLVIGADVVEAAPLLPGTPVAISVPAVGARAELSWPSLRTPSPSEPEPETAELSPEADAGALAIQAATELAAASSIELEQVEGITEEAANANAGGEEAERKFLAALVRNLSDDGALSSLTLASDTPARPRLAPPPERSEKLAALRPAGERYKHLGFPGERPPAGRDALPLPSMPQPARIIPTPPSPPPSTLEVVPPPPPPPPVRRPTPPTGPVEEAPRATPRTWRSWWRTAAAFGLGFALAGNIAVILPILAPRLVAFASLTPHAADAAHRLAPLATPPALRLADILAVPDRSPRGVDAANANFEEALKRADESLSGAERGGPDRREAKFWLRKALSTGLGDARLLWAMTQLGTFYASPESEPADFASARILWELAAAKGDPVALCFLASLAESGLGAPRNAQQALSLYQRAKANGGCRGVDDAITRLSKSTP